MTMRRILLLLALLIAALPCDALSLASGGRLLLTPSGSVRMGPPPPPEMPRDGMIFEGLLGAASFTAGYGFTWINSAPSGSLVYVSEMHSDPPLVASDGAVTMQTAFHGNTNSFYVEFPAAELGNTGAIAMRVCVDPLMDEHCIISDYYGDSVWRIHPDWDGDIWLYGSGRCWYSTAEWPTATTTVIWTFDENNATAALYFDGVSQPLTLYGSSYDPGYDGEGLVVGAWDSGNWGLNGSVSWIRIFNRYLTATEAVLFP